MRSTLMLRSVTLTAAVAFWGTAGLLPAQDYWYGTPYVNNKAATPAESYARGLGDVVRSAGQYNLATSAAAINATEAVQRNIQNREAWTNTYFEMRKANRAYRAAESRPRPTMEDLVRYAQAGKPAPLSPSEMDSVSGSISWPILLKTDRYAQPRAQLEELLAGRATYGGLSFEDRMKVREMTDTMLASLKEQVRDVPMADYIGAKKFLQSVAYDVQSQAG